MELKEGMIIKCPDFVEGQMTTYSGIELVRVGKGFSQVSHSFPPPVVAHDEGRKDREYVITDAWEQRPHHTIGNRRTSYEDRFIARALKDGEWDPSGEVIMFSTCHAYSGSVNEKDIEIVGEMREVYERI